MYLHVSLIALNSFSFLFVRAGRMQPTCGYIFRGERCLHDLLQWHLPGFNCFLWRKRQSRNAGTCMIVGTDRKSLVRAYYAS